MTTTPATIQQCPFCPYFGVEVQPVNNDFYGESAMIGDVPACEDCAVIADFCETADELLDWLAAQEATQ